MNESMTVDFGYIIKQNYSTFCIKLHEDSDKDKDS